MGWVNVTHNNVPIMSSKHRNQYHDITPTNITDNHQIPIKWIIFAGIASFIVVILCIIVLKRKQLFGDSNTYTNIKDSQQNNVIKKSMHPHATLLMTNV